MQRPSTVECGEHQGTFSALLVCVTVFDVSFAGCSSLGDLLSRSSQLGIPLRDLLRLLPVLLSSATGPQALLGFAQLAR